MNAVLKFVSNNMSLFVVTVMVAALCSARLMIAYGMVGSEDNLLFYMMGLNLVSSDQLFELNQQAVEYFTQKGADLHALYRLEFRRNYMNEFPLPGSIYLFVSRFFKGLFDPAPNLYPLFLGQSLVIGLSTAVVLSITVCTAIIVNLRSWSVRMAFGVMVIVFALSELVPVPVHNFATLLINDTPMGTVRQTFELLIRPGAQFSPFGFAPRSHFALLMVAVFALRWQGRIDWGYAVLFVMSFIHLSTSGLLLLALLAVDLILRPKELRNPLALISIIVAVSLFIYRQSMWNLIGGYGWHLMAVILAALVFGFLIYRLKVFGEIRRHLSSLITNLDQRNRISSDLLVLVGGWIVTFFLLWAVFVFANPFDKLSAFYFWGRIHGRVMMVLWPSIVFGVILLWHYRASKAAKLRAYLRNGLPILCFVAVVPLAVAGWNSWQNVSVMNRVVVDLFNVEKRLAQGPIQNLEAMSSSETVLYYAIIRTIDSGKNHSVLLYE